ncbi:acyl carrier protein [Pseudomonas coronafaciens]|uniref:acyl carrier protein n=1 Tax=Pseudomonas coronafaciens TaxID=53409 RepID=UPI000F1AA6DB|nr:phosphopantetheine-binding protein [Pseudomonas coronafaciens]RMV66559.1 Acyl carrier protein [Pseudomonas coronafaciens pv. atropurpurea]
MSEIIEKATEIWANVLGISKSDIKPTDRFFKDLKLDELDELDVADAFLALEDALGFSIPDKDTAKLNTLQSIFDYVSRNRT